MAQYLVSDDIDALLVSLLASAFPAAAIYRVAPSTFPSEPVITIRRTGGLQRNAYVDQARVDVHVYGSDATVNTLALRVQAFLNALHTGPILAAVASGPADLGGTPPRRFMYCDVLIRRSVLEALT